MPILSIAKIMIAPGPYAVFRAATGARRSIKQAAAMPGCIGAIASPTGNRTAFAVSLWENADALKAYVHAEAHGDEAKRIAEFAEAHVSGHMDWDGPIPEWTQWGDLLAQTTPRIIPMPKGQHLTEAEHLAGPKKKPAWPMKMVAGQA